MTVFYRSRDLVISENEFVTFSASERFSLSDLSSVHIVRGAPDPQRRAVSHAVAGVMIVAVVIGPILDSPTAWAVAALALIGSAGYGGMSIFARRPRWQLNARHHGIDVCLFSTTDQQTFGQVRRGLLRALEAGGHNRAVTR
jgi:hypothetical protein